MQVGERLQGVDIKHKKKGYNLACKGQTYFYLYI